MSERYLDPVTTSALRALDPAGPADDGELTSRERQRADQTLRRILATGTAEPESHSVRSAAVRRPRRRRTRWLLASAVAAIGAAAAGVITGFGQPAYADWTPVPLRLGPAQTAAAVETCLRQSGTRVDDPQTLLAERRGGWVYVLVLTSPTTEASCLLPEETLSDPDRRDKRRWGGSGEVLDEDPGRKGVRLDAYAVAEGVEGAFAWTEGAVGKDVAAVTITTAAGRTVQASVGNGRYAAWWPAGTFSVKNEQLGGAIGVDATLRDGTTVVVQSR